MPLPFFHRKTAAPSPRVLQPAPAAAAREVPPSAGAASVNPVRDGVLIAPYLTEKSARLAESGQYTFLVAPRAEKVEIARSVARRYGVHPIRVHTIRVPGKVIRSGRTVGRRSDVKKAIVTLKEGEKIPFGVKT